MSEKSNELHCVIGLGATGLSCVRYLRRQNLRVVAVDHRLDPPMLAHLRSECPKVPVFLGGTSQAIIARADRIIVSPGVDTKHGMLAQQFKTGIDVVGDIELFARQNAVPVVAVTGSNGKTTVTHLLHHMAKLCGVNAGMAGNVGTPVLDLLDQPAPDLYILELSSFQLETTYSLRPKVATILNITEDHLDRHGSLHQYTEAKRRIYQRCEFAVYNRQDGLTHIEHAGLSFGVDTPQAGQFGLIEQAGVTYLAFGSEKLLATTELGLHGQHNWLNSLAALAIGYQLGWPLLQMLEAQRSFQGLPHRLQWLRKINNVNWFNDSKATNVGACLAALKSIADMTDGKVVLIVGGDTKGIDLSPVATAAEQLCRHVVILGPCWVSLNHTFAKLPSVSQAKDMAQAVEQANQFAQPQDAVLLAPAGASFDLFNSYIHRGEVFAQCVDAL